MILIAGYKRFNSINHKDKKQGRTILILISISSALNAMFNKSHLICYKIILAIEILRVELFMLLYINW